MKIIKIRRKKLWLFILCFLYAFYNLFAASKNSVSQPNEFSYSVPELVSENRTKRILFWNTYWNKSSNLWERMFLRIVSHQCPVSNCEFVYTRELIHQADAVVFHPIDMFPKYEVPQERPPGQIWILFSIEPLPVLLNHNVNISKIPNVFNWTMTFQRNSDIVVPYGFVQRKHALNSQGYEDVWSRKDKTKLVTWMVSHCITSSGREDYAKALKKHIPVDIYGKCYYKHCGKPLNMMEFSSKKDMHDNCLSKIEEYMFYLSFENSICNDYVTEKFFKILKIKVVPIVLGGANYSSIAPPNSYIDALQLSPKKLAQYLKTVSANKTLYNSFFQWKSEYSVDIGDPILPFTCDLCAKLHGKSLQYQPESFAESNVNKYRNISEWLISTSQCRSLIPPSIKRNNFKVKLFS